MALKNRLQLLSIELIEYILLQLTCPSDLLSLALTERSLCSIIIPHFLDYCRLAFPIERTDVWEHLNAHPLFCSRVRHLELRLQPHFCEPEPQVPFNTIIPRSFRNLEEISSWEPDFNWICSVLAKMSNLKRIAFYNDGDGKYMTSSEVLPLALAAYNSGCELESIEVDIPVSDSTSDELQYSFLLTPSDENKNLQTTLFSMVNLTHLRLIGCSVLFTDVTCYWPNLEFFYFTKAGLPADEDFDVGFISRHPRLRTLYLENARLIRKSPVTANPDENIVPALKLLTYIRNIFINGSLNDLSRPVIRNLTHLTLGDAVWGDLSIFEELEALESCIIHGTPITNGKEAVIQITTNMSRRCKNLKKLAFWCIYLMLLLNEHAPVFSLFQDFPNLTHLLGVSPWGKEFPGSEGDTLLKKLYQFPKLQYIDCHFDSRPEKSYVELRRNDILQQMDYEILEYIPESCNHEKWGGGFRIPK